MDHLRQFSSKSFHSFSKCLVHEFANGGTNGRVESIMPPASLDCVHNATVCWALAHPPYVPVCHKNFHFLGEYYYITFALCRLKFVCVLSVLP